MRAVTSVLWIGLAAAFAWLGLTLGEDPTLALEPFEPGSPRVEIAGEGFHLELDVAGTPLDEPFAQQRARMEAHVAKLEAALGAHGRRAARLCWAGVAGSLVGLGLTWRAGGARTEETT